MKWLPILFALGCAGHQGPLDLVDVQRADLVVGVDVTGELEAVDSSDITPPALSEQSSFKVAWLAPEGSDVKAGEPLVNLDGDELEHALEGLRSELAEAEQRLVKRRDEIALARREADLRVLEADAEQRKAALRLEVPPELVSMINQRGKQLQAELARIMLEQTRSGADLQQRSDQADLQDLINDRERARRKIESIERGKKRLEIVAPRAGTVIYPASTQGDKRKVGDSVYHTNTLVQVAALDAMVGNGRVDEIDIGRLARGQRVTLRLDALPDLGLTGTLSSVTTAVIAESDADPSKVVRVVIAVDPPRGAGLRPGMQFRGRIEIVRVPEVVQVPANAVFVGPDGPFAYRDAPGGVVRVPLALGRRTADAFEVLAGLSAGDRVSRTDPEKEAP